MALSSHGTLIYRQPAATPGAFTAIAEMGDVAYPELSRNKFDATTQNINIDTNVLGVPRRGPLTIAMNFLPTDGSHDHLTGLQKAYFDNTIDGYKLTYPNGVVPWIMSGQVMSIAIKAPVDGKLAADVTIVFSGLMSIGGTTIGL